MIYNEGLPAGEDTGLEVVTATGSCSLSKNWIRDFLKASLACPEIGKG